MTDHDTTLDTPDLAVAEAILQLASVVRTGLDRIAGELSALSWAAAQPRPERLVYDLDGPARTPDRR